MATANSNIRAVDQPPTDFAQVDELLSRVNATLDLVFVVACTNQIDMLGDSTLAQAIGDAQEDLAKAHKLLPKA